jgi:hypothetical protein
MCRTSEGQREPSRMTQEFLAQHPHRRGGLSVSNNCHFLRASLLSDGARWRHRGLGQRDQGPGT